MYDVYAPYWTYLAFWHMAHYQDASVDPWGPGELTENDYYTDAEDNPVTQDDLDVAMDADWDKPYGIYPAFDHYRKTHPRPTIGK